MADTLQNRRDEMKDSASLSETGSDKGDNSQGNKEDVFENNSGYVEERFRVDRKKLEQMLQGKKQFLRVGSSELELWNNQLFYNQTFNIVF